VENSVKCARISVAMPNSTFYRPHVGVDDDDEII
jgi:hypothetical protein